jgi:hypothetical protein
MELYGILCKSRGCLCPPSFSSELQDIAFVHSLFFSELQDKAR